jgi:ribosomal protein L11 methyltransferase
MAFLKIDIACQYDLAEMIIAELMTAGYDSFQETDQGVEAYIEAADFNESNLRSLLSRYNIDAFSAEPLPDKNWNEEWEKNFQPVAISDQVYIRASFHPPAPGFRHEILIHPKMAFGTGHHETTSMMVAAQLAIKHRGRRVLDVGTGTGILAIMAAKLGADHVAATDIDPWSITNSAENFALNAINGIHTVSGVIDEIALPGPFHIILANINKNVLLVEIPTYARMLKDDGHLLLSGFYDHDLPDIDGVCSRHGLMLCGRQAQNKWCQATFALSPGKRPGLMEQKE